MIILGIDPGSRKTGWGIIDHMGQQGRLVESGVVRLDANHPLPQRLVVLSESIDAILMRHAVSACAIEQVFMARNARSALVLGQARGALLCTIGRAGIPIHEYAATQIKQTVVGAGRAEKSQVQHMVGLLLGVRQTLGEDEADSLTAALTHAAAIGFNRRVAGLI